MNARVAYYAHGANKAVYFGSEGLTIVLTRAAASPSAAASVTHAGGRSVDRPVARTAVKLEFLGADPSIEPSGEELANARFSYFKGPQRDWITGLKTYRRLVYRDLWPGIDLVYSGSADHLKYMFVVKPGADPGRIQLRYRGTESVSLDPEGRLLVQTAQDDFRDDKPTAYQEFDGAVRSVAVQYTLGFEPGDLYTYGFRLGEYDSTKTLVIDPAILVYAGFIGGSGDDRGHGIAVDSEGNAYITGETSSTELSFPTGAGPDTIQNGATDAFVAKVDPTGTELVYAGFIGGSDEDRGRAIAVDALGNAYIAGETKSNQLSFPVLGGPDLTHNGVFDAFVAKINPSGTNLVYSGYIRGFGNERGNGIALDAAGRAYLTGETDTIGGSFPTGNGFGGLTSFDNIQNGGLDAFVARVAPDGGSLEYAGYIGGISDDRGTGIAVDGGGSAYITGATGSGEISFPDGNGLAGLPGPDPSHNGGTDAFVAKISPSGAALVYAGYIGGSADDRANGIALTPGCPSECEAYVVGETSSTQATFPAAAGPDLTHNGGVDAFVAKIRSGGSLEFAGYLGGAADDRGNGIALDPGGSVYVAGETNSTQTSFPIKGVLDATHNHGFDAFAAKICVALCTDLSVTKSDSPDPASVGANVSYIITVTNHGPEAATDVELTDVLPATTTLVSVVPSTGSCAGSATIVCDLGTLSAGASATVTVVVMSTVVGTLTNAASVTSVENDTDPGNNFAQERTRVTLPNLVVKSLSAAAAAMPGSDIVINDTTVNRGKVAAGPSTTSFYLSTDSALDGGDQLLGSRAAIPALQPRQSSAGSTTVTIPPGTTLGRYFLIAVADASGGVAETAEKNIKTRRVNVTLPDLVVQALRGPASAAAGSNITINETTANRASVPALSSTTRYYLSADAVLDFGDTLLGGRLVPALPAKSRSAAATAVTIPAAAIPGNYFLLAVSDAGEAISEVEEANNVRAKSMTVTP